MIDNNNPRIQDNYILPLELFDDDELVIFHPVDQMYKAHEFADSICRVKIHDVPNNWIVLLYKDLGKEGLGLSKDIRYVSMTIHDYAKHWYLEKIAQ